MSKRNHLMRMFFPQGKLILVAALLLAGCAPAATPTSAPANTNAPEPTQAAGPTQPPAPVKLSISNHLVNETWHAGLETYLAEYNQLHPNVTVEQISTAFADLQARVATDQLGDNPPDLYQLPAWWVGNLAQSGILSEVPADIVADVQKNYPQGVIDAVTWDGKIHGVPMDANTTVMLYNKAMLAEAGYSRPPETLAELKEYALKLTKKDAEGNTIQYGYSEWVGNLNSEYLPFASLLYSNGGDIFAEDMSKSAFNSPEGVEVLTLMTDLVQAGAFNPELTYTDWYTDRVAITVLPNWVRFYLTTYNDPAAFGSAPVPHGNGKESGAIVYSWFIFVNEKSPNKEAAWDFIRWFTQETLGEGKPTRCAQFYYDIASVMPARFGDLEAMKDVFSTDVFPAFVEAQSYARAPLAFPQYEEAVNIINVELENAWFLKKTPEEALNDAAEQVDALLQMP